jgi:hypothetical protein
MESQGRYPQRCYGPKGISSDPRFDRAGCSGWQELEFYIAEKLGSEHLLGEEVQSELRATRTEITDLRTRLAGGRNPAE